MKKIIIATVFLLTINTAAAQVYNCNGVYTNHPCDDKAKVTGTPIPEKLVPYDAEDKKALSRKKSITHDLAMKAANINREYKLNYNIAAIEDYCYEPSTSIQECADRADDMQERIDDRVASLETIKAQKKANELQEQKLQQDEQEVVVVQQIIEATPTYDDFYPPHHHGPDHPSHHPDKGPKFRDPSNTDMKVSDYQNESPGRKRRN